MEAPIPSPLDTAHLLSELALAKQARDPVLLDLRGRVPYCDFFLICHGTNRRQVQAIASSMTETMKLEHGTPVSSIEGQEAARWILLDFGDVIVHIFDEPLRDFYDLEGLWVDAPRLEIPGVESREHAF